jgi:ribosome-associated heat shock protein Hsp15
VSDASVRLDRWLNAARIYGSRTLAQQACDGGHVRINGSPGRSSQPVRVGDEVRALAPRGQVVVKVLTLGDRRLAPAAARLLYEDHSPPPPPRDEGMPRRLRGAGRPTKQDRRALDRLRRDD